MKKRPAVSPKYANKKPVRSKSNKLLLIIAVIATIGFGGAFAYFAYDHISYMMDARAARENAGLAQDIFADQIELLSAPSIDRQTPQADMEDETGEAEEREPFNSPVFTAREEMDNDDIVAYIHIENTNVGNVVVQAEDNAFYLHRDVHRRHNVNGSLFLDYRNTPDFSDRSSIIYGHNMLNGTMFHNLRYFMNADFFNENRYIVVITAYEILTYEIFSAFSTRVDFDYIQTDFEDDDDYMALVDEIQRRSVHDLNIPVNADDRILVLSTCTNTTRDMRFVVVGVLITEDR